MTDDYRSSSFCPVCGAPLPDQARFCAYCGYTVYQPHAPPTTPSGPSQYQAPPPPPYQEQQAAPYYPTQQRKRGGIGALIAAIIIGIILFMAINYLFFGDNFGLTDDNESLGDGNRLTRFPFEGTTYSIYFNLTNAKYQEYKNTDIDRYLTSYDYSICDEYVTSDDALVQDIAAKLMQLGDAAGMSQEERINFALRFTQNITYRLDSVTIGMEDYWRFPYETLYLGYGDCEDTSFLFSAIIEAMGYDAVCIIFDDHIAVGVECPGAYGSYYSKFGTQYYYCETTSTGWVLGEMPDEYNEADIVQVE